MSGIDYTPRIYIRDFTIADYRAFVTTLEYDVVGVNARLLRSLFLRISDETTTFIALSGDEQSNGDNLVLSGDCEGFRILIKTAANYHLRGFDVSLTLGSNLSVGVGEYVLDGSDTRMLRDLFLRTTTDAYVLDGSDTRMLRDLFLRTTTGAFVLTGVDANLRVDVPIELSGDEQDTGTDKLKLSGDAQEGADALVTSTT